MLPKAWIGACALAAAVMLARGAHADAIMDWNAEAEAIGTEKQAPNAVHARTLVMVHLAMFEAVNSIEGRYRPYRAPLTAAPGAAKTVAAATAARDVLLGLYPDQRTRIEAAWNASVKAEPEGPAKAGGIDIGRRAAAATLALRADDGAGAAETWRPVTTPGAYIPTTIPIESTTAQVRPWVMVSAGQFRPPPPPALSSAAWARDYNEIRQVGGRASTVRTAEQTEIGRFWFITGARTYNPVVRQIVDAKGLDLVDCARLYTLAAMAGSDAFLAVFDAKYSFNFWRPITAVRNGDLDGNPATELEPGWLALGETPPHPEYPCAHCIVSSAVATVLQQAGGDDVEFSMTNPQMPGVARKWRRLADYRDEVSNARIWSGFHYRFSTEAAKDMGAKIGALTASTLFQPVAAADRR